VDSVNFFFVFLRIIILASIFIWGKTLIFSVVLIGSTMCFLFRRILSFFVLFEVLVFPMAIYISMGKTRERISAILMFICYTLTVSIPFFGGVLWIISVGELERFSLFLGTRPRWLWLTIIFIFIVKFPVFLLHGWLPRAHVEAPTLGSVLLASILLKLGSYGLIRLLSRSLFRLSKLTFGFSLVGAVVAGLVCFLSGDCKAFIAMSRVTHMSRLWAGVATVRSFTADPVILVSVSHGFVAACLFFFIGHFYESRASRSILILRDGWRVSVFLIVVWILVCFINAGLPPTVSLFSELRIFQRVGGRLLTCSVLLLVGGVIRGVFSFLLFDWTSFQKDLKGGSIKQEKLIRAVISVLLSWNLALVLWI